MNELTDYTETPGSHVVSFLDEPYLISFRYSSKVNAWCCLIGCDLGLKLVDEVRGYLEKVV